MQNFDYTLNKDDVAERNIIVGLLGTLNNKLSINQWRNNVPEKVDIPFYYSLAGDERYLFDMFMKPLFDNEDKAVGHYDKVPRGVINYVSTNINSASKTNPNVYGKLLQNLPGGTTKTFFAKYRPIPIIMSFDCKILVSPALDLFKISEKIKTMLYRNTVFRVDIRKTLIPAILSIPQDMERRRPIDFSFSDKKELVIEFSFDVFSYIPNFDEKSKLFAGKRMQAGMYHGIYIRNEDEGRIRETLPDGDEKVINIPNDTNFYHK